MSAPENFSWIDRPHLAAAAQPRGAAEWQWLRNQGIDVVVSLTEDPPFRRYIDDAGLMLCHVPIEDMVAPTLEDVYKCVSFITRSRQSGLGVLVHCTAGKGRTGTVLACYFVTQGLSALEAIRKIRKLRPGSVETKEQEEVVYHFARDRSTHADPAN